MLRRGAVLVALFVSAVAAAGDADGADESTPAAGAVKPARSDSKTWSRVGWQAFRWGMGKDDVLGTLGHPAAGEIGCTEYTDAADGSFSCFGTEGLFDRAVQLTFRMVDARLAEVMLVPVELQGQGDDVDVRRGELDWFRAVAAALQDKYGKPSERRGVDGSLGAVLVGTSVPTVGWIKAGLRVELTLTSHEESGTTYGGDGAIDWRATRLVAAIRYSDAGIERHKAAAKARREKAKL